MHAFLLEELPAEADQYGYYLTQIANQLITIAEQLQGIRTGLSMLILVLGIFCLAVSLGLVSIAASIRNK
jgi:hypothetical protein